MRRALLVTLLFTACEDGPINPCTPGRQDWCACPGGGEGAQVCKDDGTFGPCDCGEGGAGGGGGDGGEGGDGGTGGRPPATGLLVLLDLSASMNRCVSGAGGAGEGEACDGDANPDLEEPAPSRLDLVQRLLPEALDAVTAPAAALYVAGAASGSCDNRAPPAGDDWVDQLGAATQASGAGRLRFALEQAAVALPAADARVLVIADGPAVCGAGSSPCVCGSESGCTAVGGGLIARGRRGDLAAPQACVDDGALDAARDLLGEGSLVDVIDVGPGSPELQDLAREGGGRYLRATDPDELESALEALLAAVP